ncbi:MAG: TlyA family RNA methyltransferase [Limnochordia bacterium]|jgi:23S rRNA (cytidine1920-2'-O)/16S rRNA (cytidine1409-2'-O)-methyltransferase|nr:TlyA family RNA methyltransferase [Limnochordia bacterium]MDD2629602.1 TlyA family RNA methyltransferase [Limnochordia bacterium]MDD4517797.1 TlyA family RNA methyltransferase [Limnochordia bacterium]
MSGKKRLDVLLVERGLFETRHKAQAAIMAGSVFVDGICMDKSGSFVLGDAILEIKAEFPYVGRGGLKLEKALEYWQIDVTGTTCLDVGASTGGFTDCLLQRGAAKVIALDVGYGQLAWSLRQDPRVVTMERTNIRYVEPETLGQPVDFVVIDVSFISVTKFLDKIKSFLKLGGEVVSLVKPQFEAGPHQVGKGGLVKDPKVHKQVLHSVAESALHHSFNIKGFTFSPIRGAKGNIEYFIYLTCKNEEVLATSAILGEVESTVQAAQLALLGDN